MKLSLAVACLVYNLNPIKADQPVHCLRESLFGKWDFHVSSDQATVNVFDSQELCTHSVPNKVQLVNQGHKFSFA